MEERNLQTTKESEEIRKCIVDQLKAGIAILENIGEKCGIHKIWYLAPGIPVEKIEEVIYQLRYIIKRAASVVPEIKSRESFKK